MGVSQLPQFKDQGGKLLAYVDPASWVEMIPLFLESTALN